MGEREIMQAKEIYPHEFLSNKSLIFVAHETYNLTLKILQKWFHFLNFRLYFLKQKHTFNYA